MTTEGFLENTGCVGLGQGQASVFLVQGQASVFLGAHGPLCPIGPLWALGDHWEEKVHFEVQGPRGSGSLGPIGPI